MILQRLRAATHAEHQHLESRIDLLNRDWSLDFYRALLEKFHGFYQPLEPSIFAHSQWQQFDFHIEARRKLDWLRQDLSFLGLGEAQIDAIAPCKYLPHADSFARALGCAYVLEGSTLGGQIIARHLKKELNIEPNAGCRFFSAYGEQTGAMWREFIALLDNCENSLTNQELNELLESARATFVTLENWLDGTV